MSEPALSDHSYARRGSVPAAAGSVMSAMGLAARRTNTPTPTLQPKLSRDSSTQRKLTEQQLRDLRQIFDWLDVSGDGSLSVAEVLVALRSLNNRATQIEAEALIEEAIGEKKSSINWTEFTHVIEKGLTQNATAAQMFELLDTHHTGQVSPDVLRAALRKYGCESSDAVVDKMIRYVDSDGDGQVCPLPLHAHCRPTLQPRDLC